MTLERSYTLIQYKFICENGHSSVSHGYYEN